MANICNITGKCVRSGNNVPRGNINNKTKTRRKFYPNLQQKKFFLKELGTSITLELCTKAMRTINKNGLYPTLKKAFDSNTFALNALVKLEPTLQGIEELLIEKKMFFLGEEGKDPTLNYLEGRMKEKNLPVGIRPLLKALHKHKLHLIHTF